MKYFLLCVIVFTAVYTGLGQVISYPISTYDFTPRVFRNLLLTNQQIEDNDTINEEILDLVSPMVQDSIIGRKKEHHQLSILGWIIHVFGNYNWRATNPVKQKFVGTITGGGRSSEEEYTEYDINFDLFFHTHKYLWKVFDSYNMQGKIKRQDIRASVMPKRHHPTNYNAVPFVRDTNNMDMYKYRLHCECTPQREYRPMLHYLFYPTLPGIDLADHPNFMHRFPSMGFYGVSCLDCNHNCHPEIHPYEWLWWLNLHNGTVKNKTWMIGLMKDGSNRFHHWSHNPKTGKTSIPFAFEVKDRTAKDRTITIEHLVFGNFIDSNLAKLNLPPTLFGPDHKSVEINLTDAKGGIIPVTVVFHNNMVATGLKYWFSEVNWDEKNQIISGYINMATSVTDMYTVRVTMSQ